jgi:hypothetical protein
VYIDQTFCYKVPKNYIKHYHRNRTYSVLLFWGGGVVIRRYLNADMGTLFSIFIGGVCRLAPPMKMEQSVPKSRQNKIQKTGNYQKGRIQHSEQGESLKSRRIYFLLAAQNIT